MPGLLQIDVDHLPGRVHAGVGPPGGMHPQPLAAEGLDGPLQRRLHGRQLRLGLEAAIGSAVIFHDQAIARHQASTSPGLSG